MMRVEMQTKERINYERFLNAFAEHYKEELKYAPLISEIEILMVYFEFKGSGKTPEQWLEQQELS
jgi:hypothetical protein